jgi:hypothetical protein
MKTLLSLSFKSLTRASLTLGTAATLGLSGFACTPQSSETAVEPTETAPVETPTQTPGNETSELQTQIGESFYFRAQFQRQLSDAIFVVQEDGEENWGEVLVVNRSDRAFQVPGDSETPMWIYGTVEELTPAELEDNNVSETDQATYEGQPVIAAEIISLVPSPETLANNPEVFLNQHVTVYGKVQPVEAENTFILEEPNLFGGKGVILVQGAGADLSAVQDEENAVVAGILRPYVIADLQEEYDLTWDLELQQELEADYEQQPVIVVELALPAN